MNNKYIMLCYDIRTNAVRSKLYKYLLSIDGIPLQKSIFIIPHNAKNKKKKIDWIVDKILPKLFPTDQIHIVPLSKDMITAIQCIQGHIDLGFMTGESVSII